MISLNGVTLNDNLIWEDEFQSSSVSQNIQRTILGSTVIQHQPKIKGSSISLVALSSGDSFTGSFTREQVEGFKLIEQAGTEVSFIYDSFSAQVIIKAGGVQVKPLFLRNMRSSTDLFTGKLILIEV